MSTPLHIRDLALLTTLDEDAADHWTAADIEALFRTAASFEASLTRLQERHFVLPRQERGPGGCVRWAFTLNPLRRDEARRAIDGADQVALAEQLLVLGRAAAACELAR